MGKKVRSLLLSGLLVMVIVLVSCGGAAETEEPIVEEQPEPVVTGPQYGGTLTVGFQVQNWAGAAIGWDMVKWTWMSHAYATCVMDAMLMGDFDKGPSGTGEFAFSSTDFISDASVTGALAESWEFPSPTVVRFNLRKGVKFHDKAPTYGREFTADDVIYSFTRTIGFEEGKGRWPRHNFIKEVRKIDEYTVEIELLEPQAFWGYEIGWGPYLLVYPEESVEAGIDNWENVAGTGPFFVEDYISDATLTYGKSDNYWGTWTKDGETYQLPFVDKLVIPIIPDESARQAAFRTGKFDIFQMRPLSTRNDILDANPELNDILGQAEVLRGGGTRIALRMDKPPFDNILVRKAMAMALDRPALVDAFLEGVAQIFYHPLQAADGPDLFTPLEETSEGIQEQYRYDPEKAMEYLTQAGYPNGFQSTMLLAPGQINEDSSAMMKEYWAAIGVEVELEIVESATMLARGFDRQFDMIRTGIQARPQVFNDFTREHPWNMVLLDDDYYEEQWQLAKTTPDNKVRDPIMKDLFLYLKELCTEIEFPSGGEWTGWWPWVNNYNGEVSFGFPQYTSFAYTWLDLDMKAEMGY